mgnify:CR=1 FL=1
MVAIKAHYKKIALLFVGSLLLIAGASAYHLKADNPDGIVGVWKTGEGTAMVRIYKNGDKYQGKIVWLKEPNDPETGVPKTDKNNPDPTLQKAPLKGYRMLKDFVYQEKSEWSEGTIYDPLNGSTYSCTIKMTDPNTLEIRGYIGVSAFGRTDVWKRLVVKK